MSDPHEPAAGPSLGQRTRVAGFWAVGGQGIRILLQVLSVVVLARLLTPEDYGIFGMLMVFAGIAELFRDLGLSGAAIQAKELSRAQQSNLWWINVAFGAGISLLTVAIAPGLAWIFAEPKLTPYVFGIAPTFLLNAMCSQFSASLQRELRFKQSQLISVTSMAIALVACIVAAALGWGVWALVMQSVLASLVSIVLLVRVSSWLPRRWARGENMKPLWRFGLSSLGMMTLSYVEKQIVNFLTGRFYGARDLGSLTRSNQIVMTPLGYMVQPVSALAFAALSRAQGDMAQVMRLAKKGQAIVGYLIAIVCGGLIVTGPSLVPIVLGAGWLPAAHYTQILAIAAALSFVPLAGDWLFRSQGRPDVQLKLVMVFMPFRVAMVSLGALFHSVEAMLWFNVAVFSITWAISYYVLGRVTEVRAGELAAIVLRSLAVAGVPAAILVAVRAAWHICLPYLLDVLVFGSVYVALCALALLIPVVRCEVVDAYRSVLRRKL